MTYQAVCAECKKSFEYYSAKVIDVKKYEVLCDACKEMIHKRIVKGLADVWNKNHSTKK